MAEPLIVIGSGPASVSCAHALASRGMDVTIVDAGVVIEPDRQLVVQRLQTQEPAEWDTKSRDMLLAGSSATASGIPVKKVYGSDFAYREVRDHLPIQTRDVTAFASFAKGGLSNVWGSAVVPYRAEDIRDWPITADELAPYYREVFRFLPLAAERDDLEDVFPLHSATYQRWERSRQAKAILERMERRRRRLKRQGFTWGGSRLAVRVLPEDGGHGCAYCGLCMYGCPYGLIYSSAQTLEQLVRAGKVRYRADVVVDELAETESGVTIMAHDRCTREPLTLAADRVFLGAGVFPTARILLRSLRQPDATLTMRDSQYFLLPLMALRGTPHIEDDGLHTLAQLFIEILDPTLGEHPVHLQVYTYNDLYASAMKSFMKGLYPLMRLPANMLLGRLLVIQGYLHSDLSGTASLRLGPDGALVAEKVANPRSSKIVRKAVAKLRRNTGSLGFMPLTPMLKIGDPGQGAHIGGTFPMRRAPGPLESDVMGRPRGFSRVHVVDASVLPSIPSTTITVNAMANAYRIGSEWQHYGN